MKKTLLILFLITTLAFVLSRAVSNSKEPVREKAKFDQRIDNIFYWIEMAKKGYTTFNPDVKVKRATFTGSKISAFSVLTEDSPDVPVADLNSTQSENSVFVHPNSVQTVLNSNNSTKNPIINSGEDVYGADGLYTFDVGETWKGSIEGPGGLNNGDPTTAIGLNGRWYVNYINTNWGQSVSYSDNMGDSWTTRTIAANPGEAADKNHMWVDNSPDSPYEGNLYVAWTDFGGPNYGDIVLSKSVDHGVNWTAVENISSATAGFKHGVNLQTGPEGEVYAVWAEYYGSDNIHDEDALAIAKSMNGGETWQPAYTIRNDIRGNKGTGVKSGIRTNAFPVMAVDISNGSKRGNIYIVWTNIGEPGINDGPDMDIYMIRSEDKGVTWTDAIRVNQDISGNGSEHFFAWITCDPKTGSLSVIFYDDRNFGDGTCEVFCANSMDGGDIWEDFKVSDVSFTPSPIPGTASNYFGDYLGITSRDGFVYPAWTDNRSGSAMTYCSPYKFNALNYPTNLQGTVEFETGMAELSWSFSDIESIIHFNIYREGNLIGTPSDTVFNDVLPTYGKYYYQVTAVYEGDLESAADATILQWGSAQISIVPDSLYEHLIVDSMSNRFITVTNTGQLPLGYSISTFKPEQKKPNAYCEASGSGEQEYIQRVILGNINNLSGRNQYTDYTDLSTNMEIGEEYELYVSVSSYFLQDQVGAWIDWDQNEIFDEELINFEIIEDPSDPDTVIFTSSIKVPLGAKSGSTRLRIRLTYTGDVLPCGSTIWGEVEDYSVVVQNWLDINPVSDTVEAGNTSSIVVNFNSTGIEPGMYYASAIFNSNDPGANEVEVPLVLEVTETMVGASARGQEIVCEEEEVTLSARPYGVYDSLSFSWHSNPEGFESDLQNSIYIADSSKMFIVEMFTNGQTYSDSIYISVKPQPVVELGPDTSFCGNYLYTLDAGDMGKRYYWSTGDTTQTIQVDTNTLYQGYGERIFTVFVHGENFCINKDTVLVTYINCTGIEETRQVGQVKVFPNPNSGTFNVELTHFNNERLSIEILNQNGALIYNYPELKIDKNKHINIQMDDVSPGIYQLIIRGKDKFITRKIVIN